jgi:hypothetical protein
MLISTACSVFIIVRAESQHTNSKKIIIKRRQRILKSLSETCKQLHLETPVWASAYSNFSITNAFGTIYPRITSFKIRFSRAMDMEGCEELIWAYYSFPSPTVVKRVIQTLQVYSRKKIS